MKWTTLQVTVAVYDYYRLGDVGFIKFLFGKVPLLPPLPLQTRYALELHALKV